MPITGHLINSSNTLDASNDLQYLKSEHIFNSSFFVWVKGFPLISFNSQKIFGIRDGFSNDKEILSVLIDCTYVIPKGVRMVLIHIIDRLWCCNFCFQDWKLSLSAPHKIGYDFFLSSTLQLFTLSLHLIFLLRARQRLFCPLSELVLIFYMTIGIGLDQKNSVCVCCVNSLVVSAHWWSVFQSAYFSVRTTIINWQFSFL